MIAKLKGVGTPLTIRSKKQKNLFTRAARAAEMEKKAIAKAKELPLSKLTIEELRRLCRREGVDTTGQLVSHFKKRRGTCVS